jgi:hypothetical protein
MLIKPFCAHSGGCNQIILISVSMQSYASLLFGQILLVEHIRNCLFDAKQRYCAMGKNDR